MRICLVISKLRQGGAERIMSVLANGLARKGHEVHLLTLDCSKQSDYPLDARVQLLPLNLFSQSDNILQTIRANFQRLHVLRTNFKKISPDLIVAFLLDTSVLTLLAGKFLGIPTIVSLRQHHDYDGTAAWRWLRDRTFPWARFVVVMTESQKRHLAHLPWNLQTISNPVSPCSGFSNSEIVLGPGPCLVSMARLVPLKRLDMLIQAMARLKDKHPQWSLHIFGEGELLPELQNLTKNSGLSDRVHFHGFVHDVHAVFRQADFFALASEHEAFGNAVAEAMSCGLPALATRCDYGFSEIVRHGRDGLLVPAGDLAALTDAMDTLMSDDALRERMGKEAVEVCSRFSLEDFMRRWNALINQIGPRTELNRNTKKNL